MLVSMKKKKQVNRFIMLLAGLVVCMMLSQTVYAGALSSDMEMFSAGSDIEVHSELDESSQVIGTIEEGKSFFAKEIGDGWYETLYKGSTGYVMMENSVLTYGDAHPELVQEMKEFAENSEKENAMYEAVEQEQKNASLEAAKNKEAEQARQQEAEAARSSSIRNTAIIMIAIVAASVIYVIISHREKKK